MNDRELLELAAKAAGWTGWKSKHGYWNVESPDGEKTTHCHSWYAYCPNTGEKLKEPTFADAIEDTNWNPLIDDGDALRLAVKLKMKLEHYSVTTEGKDRVAANNSKVVVYEGDPYAATRRAIVRAAAEIAKAGEQA